MIRIAKSHEFPIIRDMRKSIYSYTTLSGGEDGTYIVAEMDNTIIGFLYVRFGAPYEWRRYIDVECTESMYEIGRLAVEPTHRMHGVARALIQGAILWCKSRNWSDTFCIFSLNDMVDVYKGYGTRESGYSCDKGKLMFGDSTVNIQSSGWLFDVGFHSTHGGGSFDAYTNVPKSIDTVPADVLDAWFEPPISTCDPFMCKSSPPTRCSQFIDAVRLHRKIPLQRCIVPGAGSSDIIFRALPLWISKSSRVAILNPTYSEYPHILKNVIGCDVVELSEDEFHVPGDVDWMCLVNPNSPTGTYMENLADIVRNHPNVMFWVDETYIDLARRASLEGALFPNLYVCKSMSKSYGLSGLRIAYITGPCDFRMERLKLYTPPWVVSYPAQYIGSRVFEYTEYYQSVWDKTQEMKNDIINSLKDEYVIHPGCANFYSIRCDTPLKLQQHLKESGIYVRCIDGGIRIAVRTPEENERIVTCLKNNKMS